MKIALYQLEPGLKKLLALFIITLTVGVIIGLIYLEHTTNYTPEGAATHYRGSEEGITEEFDIPESYAKPVSELLITTHNHIISFSFIFILLGLIFYFNSVITGFWKQFLLIEPFISTLVSFGSLWGIRFIDSSFAYIAVISAVFIYGSFFIMSFTSLYELLLKKSS
jgi:hypothetical protein